MAEDKNRVIVYADWMEKFEKLQDDEAGRLIKHFFRYINDLNPEAPDRITELSFIDIKNTLKRDLKAWKETIEEKSINGRIGNLKKWHPDLYHKYMNKEITLEESEVIAQRRKTSHSDKNDRTAIKPIANVAVSVSDSVSDNVNDIKKEEGEKSPRPPKSIEDRENDFKDKLRPFVDKFTKETVQDFFDYWTEKNSTGRKMRFESQKHFEIEKRLSTWKRKEIEFSKGGNKSQTKISLVEKVLESNQAVSEHANLIYDDEGNRRK